MNCLHKKIGKVQSLSSCWFFFSSIHEKGKKAKEWSNQKMILNSNDDNDDSDDVYSDFCLNDNNDNGNCNRNIDTDNNRNSDNNSSNNSNSNTIGNSYM